MIYFTYLKHKLQSLFELIFNLPRIQTPNILESRLHAIATIFPEREIQKLGCVNCLDCFHSGVKSLTRTYFSGDGFKTSRCWRFDKCDHCGHQKLEVVEYKVDKDRNY